MYCQKCGKILDDEAVMCPACGTPTINAGGRPAGKDKRPLSAEEAAQEKAKKRHTVLLVCLGVFALIALYWITEIIKYAMR